MIRNFFFSSMTALGLLSLGACGDDGKTSETNVQATEATTDTGTSNGSTEPGTTDTTEGTGTSITSDDPTTTTPATTTTTTSTTTTEGPNDTTTEPETTENPGTTTTEPGTTTEDTSTTDPGTTTDDPLMQCLDSVNPGDPCGECACTECLEELQICAEDAGCQAIRDCAQESGCGGIDCLGPCGTVIQMNGGPFGPAGMKAQAIGTCVDTQCQGQC